jgi:hypothetical protein
MSRAQRWNAKLALGFAAFLAVAEVARNWGDWGFWPFWLVDYLAVALLATGGVLALRDRPGASAWLAGGWGFTCAMFYMSFFSHVAELRADPNAPDHGPADHRVLTAIIGALFAVTILGFAVGLAAARGGRRDDAAP